MNMTISAAISTGYENSPMVMPSSGSTPLATFWSTDALYAWARFISPLAVTQVSSQQSSGISGMSDWR
ncbi:hypothetical protein D3C85_1433050 [compost metagenome]